MGYSITIASGKGGVGKTTVCSNLGVALAKFGKDVTILDADIEMANLELHFSLDGIDVTLNKVLSGEAQPADAVYKSSTGVKIIPAGVSLEALRKVDPEMLYGVLEEITKQTEILLIDAPAGLGRSAVISLSTSQAFLIIANPEIPSISDALKTKTVAKKLGSHELGIVLNRVSESTSQLISVREIEGVLDGKVIAAIPEDPEVKLSPFTGVPLVTRVPNSPAAVAITKLAADLIGMDYHPPEESFVERFLGGLFLRK